MHIKISMRPVDRSDLSEHEVKRCRDAFTLFQQGVTTGITGQGFGSAAIAQLGLARVGEHELLPRCKLPNNDGSENLARLSL